MTETFAGVSKRELREIVTRVAQLPCVRVQLDNRAPTCRSPIKSEALARKNWCVYCVAREALRPMRSEV